MKKQLLLFLTALICFFDVFGQASQSFTCTSSDSINNGIVLCLPFSGNANDESGNGYNGTISGATLTSDRFGRTNNAYSFNGSSNYIDLAKLLPDQTSLSISAWIKPTGNTSTNGFVFFDGDANCGNDLSLIYTNNTIKLIANKSGASMDGINFSAQATLSSSSLNGWFHIVWTMSPTQSKIYVNSILANTINSSGSNVGYHFTPTIGCFNDGGGTPCGSARAQFFQGGIDDIRVYSRLLSPSEVSILFNYSYNLGITELENDLSKINIYPNPAKDQITFESSMVTGNKLLKVDFYDMIGRNVKHFELNKKQSEIDISELNSGIYLLMISNADVINTRKIVISK